MFNLAAQSLKFSTAVLVHILSHRYMKPLNDVVILFCSLINCFLINVLYTAHPWVREGGNALEIPLDISVLSNMRQFVKYSRLKQFALRVNYYADGVIFCIIFKNFL